MLLHTLKKVTVVTEDSLRHQLVKKICELGATGYTFHEVQGFGSRGSRSDAFANNVQIDVVCSEAVADSILTYVAENYFENYACIAWVGDVQVVRGTRYVAS
jgi:nitrogen regulatory protein P-II 2